MEGGVTIITGVFGVKIDDSLQPQSHSFSDYGGQKGVEKPKNRKISKIVILRFEPILGHFWGLGVPQMIFFKNQEISNAGKTFSCPKMTNTNDIRVCPKGIHVVTDRQTDRKRPII